MFLKDDLGDLIELCSMGLMQKIPWQGLSYYKGYCCYTYKCLCEISSSRD